MPGTSSVRSTVAGKRSASWVAGLPLETSSPALQGPSLPWSSPSRSLRWGSCPPARAKSSHSARMSPQLPTRRFTQGKRSASRGLGARLSVALRRILSLLARRILPTARSAPPTVSAPDRTRRARRRCRRRSLAAGRASTPTGCRPAWWLCPDTWRRGGGSPRPTPCGRRRPAASWP